MKPIVLPLALGLALTVAPVWADDDCEAPVSHWQSREAVMRFAAQQGWQVRSLKIDDGCYEVRGRDAQGRAFKAKLAPQTLRVVKMKLREHDHDADAERHHDRGPGRNAAPAEGASSGAANSPALNPVLTPGTAPRGQIE